MKKLSCRFFSILIFLFAACISTKKQGSCSDFKKGRFKLISHFNNSYYIIDRHDSIQTETNSKTGMITAARITWESACEYELMYQPKNSTDTMDSFLQNRPVKTKILRATKDYCVFEMHVDSINFKYIDTLWRLSNWH